MSSPHSNYSDSNYPEDKVSNYPKRKMSAMAKKVNYTGTHKHSHNKGGMLGEMKGMQSHYGEKRYKSKGF